MNTSKLLKIIEMRTSSIGQSYDLPLDLALSGSTSKNVSIER